ncbi:MAG: hypothetical protein BRD23_08175 [Halobacteriales archaeon SW_9_67_25]|nr:MAG: hypothetical protein BRD23_08175 [Halobacteriales archaeon SW_9_67_25]
MFETACRFPLATSDGRDSLAVASGLVLATLVLLRVARAVWPDALAVAALALAAVPAVLFAGLLGSILQADGADPELPEVGLASLQNAASEGMGRTGVAIAGTSAMVLALALGYALPAALAAGNRNGLRAALRVRSLPGLQSGAYFAAWVGAGVLVVLGWTALGVAGTGTLLAVLAAFWFAYAHLAAARLVREGVTRASGRA